MKNDNQICFAIGHEMNLHLRPKRGTCRAGALVWWLWEKTPVQMVLGSNPCTVYWMDINCNVC